MLFFKFYFEVLVLKYRAEKKMGHKITFFKNISKCTGTPKVSLTRTS
jgi:hypothetical protein